MPVAICVELLDAAAVAGSDRVGWSCHPTRLFCALLAAARGEAERRALRWLEAQPPPIIVADTLIPKCCVRLDRIARSPTRNSNVLHVGPRVTMIWGGDADPAVIASLDAIARRIPHIGRSTGVSLVAASATSKEMPSYDNRLLLEPCDQLEPHAATLLQVPYPGDLDELESQDVSERSPCELSRMQPYRARLSPDASALSQNELSDLVGVPSPSVYTDFVVFRFGGINPRPELTVRFTSALRSAVLKAAGEDAPTVLHGHGVDGRLHVAFLTLPDVGHEHADGHLLGLAVAVPELPEAERRTVVRAVLKLRRDSDVAKLRIPRIGYVELIYEPGLVQPWEASPRRWRRGSRRWVSATPMILDRYPKRPSQIEAEIRAGLRRVGLPEPVDIEGHAYVTRTKIVWTSR